ncbi:MAG: phytanoyl-CoA dioxygenase family protein [Planctomycetota bacterium]|nr:phytanoyl-CoA dioxygenase family protein [Planctomycetota bacterium]
MKLSAKQIAKFEEDGFLILENVLSDAELLPVEAGITAWIDKKARDLQAGGHLKNLHEHEDFAHRYARIYAECRDIGGGLDLMHSYIPELFAFLRNPKLMETVKGLVGPEILCNPIQHLRAKPPAQGIADGQKMNVPWHQDSAVTWEEADRSNIVTTWIPLVNTNAQNGCMEVIPGAHKLGQLEHQAEGGTMIKPEVMPATKPVRAEIPRGGLIFMSRFTPHRSTDNMTDGVRWSLDLRYQPVGQPTGRPFHPAFVTYSESNPASVLTSCDEWKRMWKDALELAKGIPWHRTAPMEKRRQAMATAGLTY